VKDKPIIMIVDDDPTPTPDPEPEIELPDEEVPLADEPVIEEPEVELPDEEIPLADVPVTGDASILYGAMSAISGLGLAVMQLLGRKKKDEE